MLNDCVRTTPLYKLCNIVFLLRRKRFGKNNVILSDIRKPPSNVFHSGESTNGIHCTEFCSVNFSRFRQGMRSQIVIFRQAGTQVCQII